MDPITIGLLAGGGLGLGKGFLDQGKEQRQRQQEAAIARWSPWTGMHPNQIQQADPLGSTMQGLVAGGQMGQGLKAAGFGGSSAGALGATNVTPGGYTGMQQNPYSVWGRMA